MLAQVSRGDVGIPRRNTERQFLTGVEAQRERLDAVKRRGIDLGDNPVDR